MQIQNLQRHLQVLKSESLTSDAAKENIIKGHNTKWQQKMTERERMLMQEKEKEVQQVEAHGRKKILDLAAANDYLEKFNKQQVQMLEEADHAFAESLYEKENGNTIYKIKEMTRN
eukprot:TRINITY_DN121_c0_g1_i8.p1 TRINITY_DN121_c0_g1~~TRINITY_DN121_c0_g1_i8.p1  ORF type:complete len:116 (-),score=29.44 TRINITY_DN121_c0_g1_i8:193-540(-)